MSIETAIGRAGTFMFDRDAETMPRLALAALQATRVKDTLERAYALPHYREKFDAAGVRPADFRSLADIGRFPFTLKSDLRDHYPFGMFAVPREKLLRLHASSGTTGKPTVVGYTKRDLDTWTDLMARSLACAGVEPGDIVHNAYRYGLFTGGLGVHYGAERLGCTVVPVSGGATERQVTLLADFGAQVLCATPSYALNIAEVAVTMGVDLGARAAAGRRLRRGAVERGNAARTRSAAPDRGDRHLRSIRDPRPGRRLRVPCRAIRSAWMGGSFPV